MKPLPPWSPKEKRALCRPLAAYGAGLALWAIATVFAEHLGAEGIYGCCAGGFALMGIGGYLLYRWQPDREHIAECFRKRPH